MVRTLTVWLEFYNKKLPALFYNNYVEMLLLNTIFKNKLLSMLLHEIFLIIRSNVSAKFLNRFYKFIILVKINCV